MGNCYENVHMYAHEGTNKILNQQRYLRKETKMITYISDPHSKLPNHETKLARQRLILLLNYSMLLIQKHDKSYLGGVLETKQWRKWNFRKKVTAETKWN